MDLMIDIEGLATGPETTILTIAAQAFDPLLALATTSTSTMLELILKAKKTVPLNKAL
jgi:hypothetical protein